MVKKRVVECVGGGGACVYVLHFPDGGHYVGFSSVGPERRLRRHVSGRGSGWVYRRAQRVGVPVVGAVVWYGTVVEARRMERVWKRRRPGLKERCEVCRRSDGKGVQADS